LLKLQRNLLDILMGAAHSFGDFFDGRVVIKDILHNNGQ
jgi:hypothetical protein